jgi:hypothetical protein
MGEAPMLPELLSQIRPDQKIASVTADRAYDTRKCHDAIAERGAHAVIPPRKNATPWKAITADAVARNEALRASDYLGRALWRRWSGYRRRSRAETKRTASNCRVRSSCRGTSAVRSPSPRSGSPCSTASPPSARPSRRSQDRSAQGNGRSAHHRVCATEPSCQSDAWPAPVTTAVWPERSMSLMTIPVRRRPRRASPGSWAAPGRARTIRSRNRRCC